MKKMILAAVIAAMVGWAVYDLLFAGEETAKGSDEGRAEISESEATGLAVGDIAPDFELVTLEGQTVHLSDYRGQRVFVNFWATWCPPCRAEMPDMQKLYEEQDIPVEILAINLTSSEKSEEEISDFVQDFELSFPILLDKESEIANKYRVQAYPTSYMIDSEGRISFMAPGAMNLDIMAREVGKMN